MQSLLELILIIIQLYMYAIIISIVINWLYQFNVINTNNQLVYIISNFFYRITEPLLKPIRRRVPNLGGIDISPMILILGIFFLRNLLIEYWPR
tara:strand:- start:14 stop:295 length:282 start_codon:yes stop_codon:yes gene_type:complete